jgi:outer membrane receptor protein involved in Fe transport
MIRGLFKAFFLLFICSASVAQGPGRDRAGGGMPLGTITGRVLSALDERPVEFATITVKALKDSSIVTGTITGADGRFAIEDVRMGRFSVDISFIGFQKYSVSPVVLNPKEGLQATLGDILLEPLVEALEAAEVVEKRAFMELMMDKRIYNVGENLGVAGGSASDVLETLPSIEVDADGTISLRGSENVNILIDGKPSALAGDRQTLLEQIPSSSIERVEVITNPSAKYDADGMTGIINIVLKKSKLSGFHGNASVSLATGDQYNASFSLNYRQGKLNLYTNYGFRYADRFNRGFVQRTTFRDNLNLILDQTQDGFNIRQGHNLKTGFDLNLSERSEFSFSGTLNQGKSDAQDVLLNQQWLSDNTLQRRYERAGIETGDNLGFDLTAGWKTEFEGRDHFITADAQYGRSTQSSFNSISNAELDAEGNPLDGLGERERNEIPGQNQTFLLQSDYSRPTHEGDGKFETGYKTVVRTIENGFFGEDFNLATQEFEPQTQRNNDFRFTEAVHAVYGSFGRKIDRISVQAGLRAEQVFSESFLITTGERFTNNYFSLFPSAFFTYSVSDQSDVNLSYSRRINRPGARQLNPFPSFRDELNIFNGNPFLLPEYINAIEAAFSTRKKGNTLLASVYMQDVSNVTRRFNRVDENGVTFGTWENIDRSQSYGVELALNSEITKWWSLNLSGNAYRRDNNGGNLQEGLANTAYSWSLRGMSSMKFENGWNFQVSGFYRAPEEFIQGDFSGFWFTDVAIKKSILNNKGSLTLNLRDVFDTREFTFNINDPSFTQVRYRKRESRNLFLTFTYKFGKLEDRRSRRRSRTGGGDDGGFDDME